MKSQHTTVQSPIFLKGHHPNSLRHLPPAHHWTIHIDETGNQFGSDKLKAEEFELPGKFVALVVPQKIKLPALPHDFHAVNYQRDTEGKAELDNIFNTILSQKGIGVVGIHYDDAITQSATNWWAGVNTLLRLVLKMLPLKTTENGNNSIKIFIEQRNIKALDVSTYKEKFDESAYKEFEEIFDKFSQKQFNIIADNLKTELKSIDPERFSNFGIQVQVVKKDEDSYNGYVDTIAHSWGSTGFASERYKKAKFSGHCFLNKQDLNAIERLYDCVDDPKNLLAAKDWYNIMLYLDNEPAHSILHKFIENVGKTLKKQKDDKIYSDYIHEVQSRLKSKDYKSHQLKKILQWLQDYKPKKARLPLLLEFELLSLDIVSDNHLGTADHAKIHQLLTLGQQLIEEDAQEVAHAYLRLAVSFTNIFAFEQAYELLSQDFMHHRLAIGRSNYAKVLSSLGQYYAFTHQPNKAIECFTQAIAEFEKLSDKTQSQNDIQQTKTYLLLSYLQQNEPVMRQKFQEIFNTTDLALLIKNYASNESDKNLNLKADDKNYVFKHHAILRTLNQGNFDDLIDCYVKEQEQWFDNPTKEHPYQAINFWRGMLLAQRKQPKKAQLYFDKVFNNCESLENLTMLWIYLVFAIVVEKLGFKHTFPTEAIQEKLKHELPNAPHEKLAELKSMNKPKDLLGLKSLIYQTLPFNFS